MGSILVPVKIVHSRQRLAATSMFLRSCVLPRYLASVTTPPVSPNFDVMQRVKGRLHLILTNFNSQSHIGYCCDYWNVVYDNLFPIASSYTTCTITLAHIYKFAEVRRCREVIFFFNVTVCMIEAGNLIAERWLVSLLLLIFKFYLFHLAEKPINLRAAAVVYMTPTIKHPCLLPKLL